MTNKSEALKTTSNNMVTGIRPTGSLTIANYLGAVKPLIENAKPGTGIFIADLHAITDNEPEKVSTYRLEVIKDYLALGVDTTKCYIYLQSSIGRETTLCTYYLSRLMSVAELLRVPTLKDKLKRNASPETANNALLTYPLLMAADIFLQKAALVPIGEDQVAHLEVARKIAKKFNKLYGPTIIEPRPLEIKTLRLMSIKGEGKMSKSNPEGAIFLTDTPEQITKKIKSAPTANPGEMSDKLENLILLFKLISNSQEKQIIDKLISRHLKGEKVMSEFKQKLTERIINFIAEFQANRQKLNNVEIEKILKDGAKIAKAKAESVLHDMEQAMKFI